MGRDHWDGMKPDTGCLAYNCKAPEESAVSASPR